MRVLEIGHFQDANSARRVLSRMGMARRLANHRSIRSGLHAIQQRRGRIALVQDVMDSGDFLCHEIGRLHEHVPRRSETVPRIVRHSLWRVVPEWRFAHAGDPRRLLEVGDR